MKKLICVLLIFNSVNANCVKKNKLEQVGSVISMVHANSSKLMSRQTLSTAAIIALPYFYFCPSALTRLSEMGASLVIKINSLIAQGIVQGLAANPAALSKLAAITLGQQTGKKLVSKITDKLSDVFLASLMFT